MQHIITDEEAERAWNVYAGSKSFTGFEAMRKALTDFLDNRPQVAQLRPIAEMPETVPEGCIRMFGCAKPLVLGYQQGESYTHAIDIHIQLPTSDPDAEERRQFEAAFKQVIHEPDLRRRDDTYEDDETADFWSLWKLAKKGGDK